MSILIVEDEEHIAEGIKFNLEAEGFEALVVDTGEVALEEIASTKFDAVILDVMLPGMDGFEVLRQMRARCSVPVLMLTGRGEEPDRIVGLELGADDYLPKTFSTRELLARLRAVIRRSLQTFSRADAGNSRVVVGGLNLHPESRTVTLGNELLSLTAVEFDILLSLARAPGRIKTREQLLLEAADRDFDVFDRSIDVHISSLRKKLKDDPKEPTFIVTVRSAGYMMRKPGSEPFV